MPLVALRRGSDQWSIWDGAKTCVVDRDQFGPPTIPRKESPSLSVARVLPPRPHWAPQLSRRERLEAGRRLDIYKLGGQRHRVPGAGR